MGLRSGPEYDRELNFEFSIDPEADELEGDYYGFEKFRVCTWHGDDVQGHYTHWLNERFPDASSNRSSVNPEPDPRYTAPQARKPRMPEQLYPTNYVAEMTLEYLDRYARGAQEKPFLFSAVFPIPIIRLRLRANIGICMTRPTLSCRHPSTTSPMIKRLFWRGCIKNLRMAVPIETGCVRMPSMKTRRTNYCAHLRYDRLYR